MALFPELEGLTCPDLFVLFSSQSPCGIDPEERELWLEEIAVRIAKSGTEGFSFLLQNIPGADPSRLRAILLSFSFLPEEIARERMAELKKILLTCLGSEDPILLAQAVDGLNSLGVSNALERVLALLNHQSPYVVGSVLRYLSQHYPERAKPILLESLKSREPIVRQNAIDELDDLACAEAVPHLRPLLQDEDKHVRQAAETALANFGRQM